MSFVTTLLLLDIGVSVSYPTVVISALTGLNNESNPNELLHMNAAETSWMGEMDEFFFIKFTILGLNSI